METKKREWAFKIHEQKQKAALSFLEHNSNWIVNCDPAAILAQIDENLARNARALHVAPEEHVT